MENEILVALEVDALTGEEIIRELTAEEIAEREQMAAEALEKQAKSEAKIAARQSALSKLAELGLTEEEIAAL
jgi:DNA-binding NarL/FixJ family response regulator